MCGILGIAVAHGQRVSLDDAAIARMRDSMSHRGPDGAGLWRHDNVVLAHRRLIVVDPTDAASQPMRSPDGRFVLVYNGELYNDAELRTDLTREGASFRTISDTETVLHALARWGARALPRLRGMYALALYDTHERTLLLARDPLGIKPLYYVLRSGAPGADEIVFASEPQAILTHPEIPARPDIVGISAYLSTIRLTLGPRTLFAGIRTLLPGESIVFDLSRAPLLRSPPRSSRLPRPALQPDAIAQVRETVQDSVRRHLHADVPLCALLSGGLDSSIVCAIVRGSGMALSTYCSGAPAPDDQTSDLHHARAVAAHLGTRHAQAPVTRELFAERWPEMVNALGVPLGTPNEVAINEVARRLRADGMIVALSGEGADELFAGYDAPLTMAADFERRAADSGDPASDADRGLFQLNATSWITVDAKPSLFNEHAWRAAEHDHPLRATYEDEFAALASETPDPDPLQAHLRFQRRINLAGLLSRLDTSTMLAGVEGRTPFADSAVASLAEQLPLALKFVPSHAGSPSAATKIALRRAFEGMVPEFVLTRPKASFPLPFQGWIADHARHIRESALLRELFTTPTLHAVAAEPEKLWRLAWPMANLALWSRRWWG